MQLHEIKATNSLKRITAAAVSARKTFKKNSKSRLIRLAALVAL